jgi:hypothetical protein
MTENEWLGCTDPTRMLKSLEGTAHPSARKARLFAVAVCRRIWHLLPDDRSRHGVEVAERYADGRASRRELTAAQRAIRDLFAFPMGAAQLAAMAAWLASEVQRSISTKDAVEQASMAAGAAGPGVPTAGVTDYSAYRVALFTEASRAEAAAQAGLLRDVLGLLPFRRTRLDPRWLTSPVLSLARAAYEERVAPDPRRMGWLVLDPVHLQVLADALEEAGADDPEILGHLRGPVEHVRGFWCVDLLLGKE